MEARRQKPCSRPSEPAWCEGKVYEARIWEILNVKEFGIYPVINPKCLKDYEESGNRIKLVFISNMRQMN